jgi:hypothetical protein
MYLRSVTDQAKETSEKLLAFHKEASNLAMHAKENPKLNLLSLQVQTVGTALSLLALESEKLTVTKLACNCDVCQQKQSDQVGCSFFIFFSTHLSNI